jgi:hypothetical protein
LTTQVILSRYPHSLRSSDGVVVASGPKAPPDFSKFGVGIGPGGRFKGFGGGRSGFPGFPGFPGMQGGGDFPGPIGIGKEKAGYPPGTQGAPGSGGGEEAETNMELVLYGVVTLYERPRALKGR